VIADTLKSGPPLKIPVLAALIGPDCSGKSTLAKALMNLGVSSVYKGGPTKNVTEGLQLIEERLKSLSTVVDLYGVAEHINNIDAVVYAPIFGYTPTPEEEQAVREFEARWAERIVLVYCQTSLEVLKQRLQKRGDPFVTGRDLQFIVDRYWERLATTCLTCISVDTQSTPPIKGALAIDTTMKELIKWSLHL